MDTLEHIMSKPLDQILTPEQLMKLKAYLEKNAGRDPTSFEFTNGLRELFIDWRSELEDKGVLPEYLAICVGYLTYRGQSKTKSGRMMISKTKRRK